MRQHKNLLGIVWLLLILAACAAPAVTPASSGGRLGPIVFSSNRGADYSGIYVMNADGSNPRNLTNNPADDQYPNIKP